MADGDFRLKLPRRDDEDVIVFVGAAWPIKLWLLLPSDVSAKDSASSSSDL